MLVDGEDALACNQLSWHCHEWNWKCLEAKKWKSGTDSQERKSGTDSQERKKSGIEIFLGEGD